MVKRKQSTGKVIVFNNINGSEETTNKIAQIYNKINKGEYKPTKEYNGDYTLRIKNKAI